MSNKITTEYKQNAEKKNDEIDLLQGRMSYAILDVIDHMKACEMSEEEIMKLILRDVQQIVDIHFKENKIIPFSILFEVNPRAIGKDDQSRAVEEKKKGDVMLHTCLMKIQYRNSKEFHKVYPKLNKAQEEDMKNTAKMIATYPKSEIKKVEKKIAKSDWGKRMALLKLDQTT
jgi:hypothetical protein